MVLRERPPIPYVPEKDSVQETVSSFKEAYLKSLIKEGTKLRVPIWHSGTREAFLIQNPRECLGTLVGWALLSSQTLGYVFYSRVQEETQ